MAPVVHALRRRNDRFETIVVATAQHRQMLDQVLSIFRIDPDVDLDLMRQDQPLSELAARVLTTMDATLRELQPDLLDGPGRHNDGVRDRGCGIPPGVSPSPTSKPACAAMTCAIRFPEEMNRRLTSVLTSIHLAPTPLAAPGTRTRERAPPSGLSSPETRWSTPCISFCRSHSDERGTPLEGIPSRRPSTARRHLAPSRILGPGSREHLSCPARSRRALCRSDRRLPGASQPECAHDRYVHPRRHRAHLPHRASRLFHLREPHAALSSDPHRFGRCAGRGADARQAIVGAA